MLKNKRILLIGLVLLLLAIIPNMVNAAAQTASEKSKTSTGKEVTWSYELDGENAKNLKCTNISSVSGDLTIPSTIDEFPVISIGDTAFDGASGLMKIKMPDGITSIGNRAFRGCSGLRNIEMSNNINYIGAMCFENCSGLDNIIIPNSVTYIGTYAFKGCSRLRNVTLSDNLSKIKPGTFCDCKSLTEISLPENLTTIEGTNVTGSSLVDICLDYPFNGCTSLKYIRMPENIASIADNVFRDCKNLTIYAEEESVAAEYAKNNNIKLEKIENWDKRNENAGSDVSAPTVSSMYIDKVSGYYNSTTKDFRVPRNVEISIVVEFSEQIKGTKVPTLTIKCGEGANIELKNGTITGNKIVYSYKIKQEDEGLITAVKFEGGDISDYSGNKAVLSVKELGALSGTHVYAKGSAVGSNTSNKDKSSNSSTSNDTSSNGSKKDTTVATVKLPNTGKVILAWIIGIVAVSGITAHIRYKKIYIK